MSTKKMCLLKNMSAKIAKAVLIIHGSFVFFSKPAELFLLSGPSLVKSELFNSID